MKKILITILAVLSFVPLRAQITHAPQGQIDETAATILKNAAARFNQNVSFSVTATMFDGQKKQLAKHSAQILYHKGKYHLTMGDQEIISDGTTVWQWNKSAHEVSVTNMVEDEVDLLNPGRLLANYQKNFRAKYIRTDEDGTAIVDLTPRSTRNYHKIRLFVAEKDGLLRRIEVHKYDSGREVYDISSFKRVSTPVSAFSFDKSKHSEVELIDMR